MFGRFAYLFVALLSGASMANGASGALWHDMARDCEAVILEQSIVPLEKYRSAPFSTGKPGEKEVAFYNPTQELVAVARLIDGATWDQCLIREVDEDEGRARSLAAKWIDGLAAAFSTPPYIGVDRLGVEYVNPGVFRCDEGTYILSIHGFYGRDYWNAFNHRERSARDNGRVFRVFVVQQPSKKADELCGKRGAD